LQPSDKSIVAVGNRFDPSGKDLAARRLGEADSTIDDRQVVGIIEHFKDEAE